MNSLSTVLMPSSDPTSAASFHGTPMSHAMGANTQPAKRSSVSGAPPISMKLIMPLSSATSAMATMRMARILS